MMKILPFLLLLALMLAIGCTEEGSGKNISTTVPKEKAAANATNSTYVVPPDLISDTLDESIKELEIVG